MKVSVIIPVYNGEKYLGAAIDSVLCQEPEPAQVLVVDDGSSDGSQELARSYSKVEVHSQPHAGPAAARNLGLQHAHGDTVAFLDADDLWPPGRLTNLPEVFGGNEPLMLFGRVEPFISPDATPEAGKAPRLHEPVAKGYLVGAMLTQRKTFAKVGYFDARWRAGEFIDWYLRAKEQGVREVIRPEVALLRRLHADNHGRRNRDAYSDIAKVLLTHRRAQRKEGSTL